MFRDRRNEAILKVGDSVIVDTHASTDMATMIEAAYNTGIGVALIDVALDLDTTVERSKIRGVTEPTVQVVNGTRTGPGAARPRDREGVYRAVRGLCYQALKQEPDCDVEITELTVADGMVRGKVVVTGQPSGSPRCSTPHRPSCSRRPRVRPSDFPRRWATDRPPRSHTPPSHR